MASRPIFLPNTEDERSLVETIDVDFDWNPGLAPVQKMKNVAALHDAAKSKGLESILEVSTKSSVPLGRSLSAFNLSVDSESFGRLTLEAAFQGSKVFAAGGPFTDLYKKDDGSEIKKDVRLKSSGPLEYFLYENSKWSTTPLTAFYDWLYISALQKIDVEELFKYQGFTDIEFNPNKSINCQARSVALYLSLRKRGLIQKGETLGREQFLKILSEKAVKTSGLQGAFL